MKKSYFNIMKPLEMKKFEQFEAPLGWIRIDILKKRLKEDKIFRSSFTKEEIKKIKEVRE